MAKGIFDIIGDITQSVAADSDKVALLLEHGADVTASGVEAYIARELATEDPDGYIPYWDGLRASKSLVEAARRQ